jgi:hypothetical protein
MPLERLAELALALIAIDGGLGHFEKMPHGSPGYQVQHKHCSGMIINSSPVHGEYASVVMSGAVASCIVPEILKREFERFEQGEFKVNITRLDLAFNTVALLPVQLYEAVLAGRVRTKAERKTLRRIMQPLEENSDTVYLGARTSERMLRCYRKDGYTRVEIELKGARAFAVFFNLLGAAEESWAERGLAHLLDFCDFDIPAWAAFCEGAKRAGLVLAKLASSVEKIKGWVFNQVASSLAVIVEAEQVAGRQGLDWIEAAIVRGFEKFGSKHRALLAGLDSCPAYAMG